MTEPTRTTWPWATLALALPAVVAALVPALAHGLEFSRAALAEGEAWRWLTGHFTHWTADHLLWDLGAFLVLGWLCEADSRRRMLACVGVAAVLIPVGVWLLHPDLDTYRGLSGLDSALFALLLVTVLRRSLVRRDRLAAVGVTVLSIAFFAKVGYEIATGTTLFVDSEAAGMVPLPIAHAVGCAVGVLMHPHALAFSSRGRQRWPPPIPPRPSGPRSCVARARAPRR